MNLPSTADQNQTLLNNFYTAFAQHDGQTMAACYHVDASFCDPAFGTLRGRGIGAMWQILIARSSGKLEISFSEVSADDTKGTANWTAKYVFSKTGRNVINHVKAQFEFKDGLIYRHTDDFDFHKWAKQALGWKGWLLGGTAFLKTKVRQQALRSLDHYLKKTVN
jgi:hypothetical protein